MGKIGLIPIVSRGTSTLKWPQLIEYLSSVEESDMKRDLRRQLDAMEASSSVCDNRKRKQERSKERNMIGRFGDIVLLEKE